ncbi:hypothetical protein PN36_30795 [Candidatus Thiomargarita nelsonii]|uniref:Uncharacterized protein n=1 Tax=Candidatus Thiomargarita nelsonii TaxID=1003181 RepID=A0A0A6RNQ2_9GAMM|nr:hypothetical protein PN36_30795 [Candidatus Thiomargarita nelsonii]
MTDVTVLEFTNSTAVLKDHFGYDALKGVLARYKKSERKRVDYLEVLEINDRKKPVFLNIVNLLRKMLKGFLNVAKEVFDPPIKPRKEIGSRTEIKEWMR